VSFGPAAERIRRRVLSGLPLSLYLWRMLPLAAFAGLRITRLDEQVCSVRLPGGWRTRNPFGSTYFAAQAMAAEMSTGAPGLVLREDAPRSISMLPVALRASYLKRLSGPASFTCEQVPELAAAIARAAASDEPQALVVRSTGRDAAGEVVAEFEISWSFKRRAALRRSCRVGPLLQCVVVAVAVGVVSAAGCHIPWRVQGSMQATRPGSPRHHPPLPVAFGVHSG
jgi:hypothetical protein